MDSHHLTTDSHNTECFTRRTLLKSYILSAAALYFNSQSSGDEAKSPLFTLKQDCLIKEAKQLPLPGGDTMNHPKFLVIHFTCGMTGRSSVQWWKNPKAKGACAHFVIERDGELLQCRPCNRTCGHAGVSYWKGTSGLNSCSIGIELANAGNAVKNGLLFDKYRPQNGITAATHKNGLCGFWENYSEAQLKTCFELARTLHRTYSFDDIVGHDDIAPQRKNDPGPLFPMAELKLSCGVL